MITSSRLAVFADFFALVTLPLTLRAQVPTLINFQVHAALLTLSSLSTRRAAS